MQLILTFFVYQLQRLISQGSNILGFAPALVASKVGHWCRMRWFTRSRQKLDKVWVTSLQVQVCTQSMMLTYTDETENLTWSQEPYLCKAGQDWKKKGRNQSWLIFLGLNCYVGCLALPSKQVANDNVTWNTLTNEGVLQAKHHTTLDSIEMFFFLFFFMRRREALTAAFRKDTVSQGISRSAGALGVWQG